MCIAVPGKIVEIFGEEPFGRTGKVDFGGVRKDVSLVYLPEAKIADYVLVHVGFALSIIDETEARKITDDLILLEEGEDGKLDDSEDRQ